MDRSGTGNRAWRLLGLLCAGTLLLLATPMACGGGAAGDGGAGLGGDGSGGSASGGSGSGGRSAGAGVELAEYCELRAEYYFDYLQACYGSQDYPESYRAEHAGGTEARCLNAASAISGGRLDYDPAQAAACVLALADVDCVAGYTRAECEGVFEGQSDPGDDCYWEETLVFLVGVSTCKGGYCTGVGCPGTCAALPAPGEACDIECQAGSYCDGEECQELPGIGESCPDALCVPGAACSDGTCRELVRSSADTCDEDQLCAGTTVCVSGSCLSRVEVGDPCRLPVHCPSPSTCRDEICQLPGDEGSTCARDADCVEDLYCAWSADPQVCKAFVSLGEVCGGEENAKCAPGQVCVQSPEEVEATCRTLVSEGESCADGFQLCEPGVYCSADLTCEPPGAEGDSCWSVRPCEEGLGCRCAAEDTVECATSQQDDGDTCQPLLADGEPCYSYVECESLECDLTGSTAPDEPGVCTTTVWEACLP